VDPLLSYARELQQETIALLRELVECESPSDDPSAVNRFVDLFASKVSDIARIETFPGGAFGRHLRCEFNLPAALQKSGGQVLALGHSDTVWPIGTLTAMPYREAEGRVWGPGALDMKAGLAFFVTAMRALRDLDKVVSRRVVLQINADEEMGSDSSRPLTEEAG